MNILFITDNFYPEKNAPAKRTFEHCREWVEEKHEINVITCNPNFPLGKLYSGYKNKLYQTEIIKGINVKRVWSFIASNKGFVLRILDYLSFMVSSILCGLFSKKPDVLIATSPQFFSAVSGWVISFIKRTPFILEIRDLWPESIKTVGAIKNKIVIRILQSMAIFLYKKSDAIICVSHAIKERIKSYGINENKIYVITNGIDVSDCVPSQSNQDIYKKHKINQEKFIISYIGTIGMAHGLEVVIDASKKLPLNKVIFLIIGEGAHKEKLEEAVLREKIDNIIFLDQMDWQDIVNIQQIIDVNLIHLIPDDLFKTVIPSKIFESMALKKPIIIGVQGEAEDIIIKSNSGIRMEPGNSNSLVESIEYFYKDKSLCLKSGENGYKYVKENYDRSNLALKMLNVLKRYNK